MVAPFLLYGAVKGYASKKYPHRSKPKGAALASATYGGSNANDILRACLMGERISEYILCAACPAAAAFLITEKSFRKIQSYRDLGMLRPILDGRSLSTKQSAEKGA